MSYKVATLLAGLIAFSSILATPMVEVAPRETRVTYQNGDTISVICTAKNCEVLLHVEGSDFALGAKDLGGLEPDPHGIQLFVSTFAGRSNRFSFRTQVVCPEVQEGKDPDTECFADVLMVGGKAADVSLYRRKETSHFSRKVAAA